MQMCASEGYVRAELSRGAGNRAAMWGTNTYRDTEQIATNPVQIGASHAVKTPPRGPAASGRLLRAQSHISSPGSARQRGLSPTARATPPGPPCPALPSPRPPSHTPPLGLSPGRALLAQPLRPPPAHRSLRDPAAPLRRTEERPPPLSTATPPHTSAQRSRLGPPRLSGARCRLRRSPLPPAATSGCCPAPAT